MALEAFASELFIYNLRNGLKVLNDSLESGNNKSWAIGPIFM